LYLNLLSNTMESCPPDFESATLGQGQESP